MSETPKILTELIHFLDDIQASDLKVIDVRQHTTITDYMLICNGRSSRHVKSIAQNILEKMKSLGIQALSQTGLEQGDWVLVDFGDYVVHVMQPETRAFYNIEGLWEVTP